MPRKKKIEEAPAEQPVKKRRGRPKKNVTNVTSDVVSAELFTAETGKKTGCGGNNNLIPFSERTEEEQREIRVKGGKASGEARRRKKELREFMRDFLMQDANAVLKKNMKALGVEEDDMTNLAALCIRVFSKGVNQGDLNAARTAIEWAGMAPLQQERENEAIARMSQVMQLAGVNEGEEDEEETVVFYIPQNGRDIVNGDNLITISD